ESGIENHRRRTTSRIFSSSRRSIIPLRLPSASHRARYPSFAPLTKKGVEQTGARHWRWGMGDGGWGMGRHNEKDVMTTRARSTCEANRHGLTTYGDACRVKRHLLSTLARAGIPYLRRWVGPVGRHE